MERRRFLIAAAVGGLSAGCLGSGGGQPTTQTSEPTTDSETVTNSPTDRPTTSEPATTTVETPIYDPSQKPDMIPPIGLFPDSWRRNDEINEDFDAVYFNEDQSVVVFFVVRVGEQVAGARGAFDDLKSRYRDPQSIDIGDEAFWDTRESVATTIFRHSNAIGESWAVRESGANNEPDVTRSHKYAFETYDYWQGEGS